MQTTRVKGFVVGENKGSSGSYWTVRVKDSSSQYDGNKLNVLSVHNNISLGRGLNVNFIIGTIDGPNGVKVNKAVDVNVE